MLTVIGTRPTAIWIMPTVIGTKPTAIWTKRTAIQTRMLSRLRRDEEILRQAPEDFCFRTSSCGMEPVRSEDVSNDNNLVRTCSAILEMTLQDPRLEPRTPGSNLRGSHRTADAPHFTVYRFPSAAGDFPAVGLRGCTGTAEPQVGIPSSTAVPSSWSFHVSTIMKGGGSSEGKYLCQKLDVSANV